MREPVSMKPVPDSKHRPLPPRLALGEAGGSFNGGKRFYTKDVARAIEDLRKSLKS